MDDQEFDPHSAPPATSEPVDPNQPLSPWRILQPTQPQPPAPPSDGGLPSMPIAPAIPGASPTPPPPGAPPYPSYPAYPPAPYPYPTYPTTPGAAAGVPGTLPPGVSPPESATPYYPIAPGSYPYAPTFPASATIPLAPTRQRSLAQPFPAWLAALIAVGSLALLVAAFLVGALVEGQDWAGSAFVAGIVAAVLALGAIALFIVRMALGRRAGAAIALGVVGIVLLVAVGLGGLAGAAPIHGLQAHSLEAGGSWGAAIHEYALSGERAPNAPDIARVYDEWGESLLKQNAYSAALDRFNTVVTTYAQSGAAALDRANRGLFNTYGSWITANTPDVPYANAIAFIEQYIQNSACKSQCLQQAITYAAQGHFQYGEQLLAQGSLQGAIAQFEAVQTQYPDSAYVSQAHAAAAKAYLALGKQQINGESCATDAVATYQILAKNYSDTPEGKQAQAALKAPVTVTGHISGPYPRNPTPTAVLSTHIDPNTFFYSSEYTTAIDAGNGSFTFHNVKQGNYNFSTVAYLPGVIDYVYWIGANNDFYFVQAGPLCTVALDNLESYPSA